MPRVPAEISHVWATVALWWLKGKVLHRRLGEQRRHLHASFTGLGRVGGTGFYPGGPGLCCRGSTDRGDGHQLRREPLRPGCGAESGDWREDVACLLLGQVLVWGGAPVLARCQSPSEPNLPAPHLPLKPDLKAQLLPSPAGSLPASPHTLPEQVTAGDTSVSTSATGQGEQGL